MSQTKICSKCKLEKPASEYNKWKLSKDGLYSRCKSCHKHENNTERQVIKRFINAHKNRIKCSKSYSKEYDETKFVQWLYENNFQDLYNNWKDSNYDKTLAPSVDRINAEDDYKLSNMQLITWDLNHLKIAVDIWNERGFSGITSGKTRHRASHIFFGEQEVAYFNSFKEAWEWKLVRIKKLAEYLKNNGAKVIVKEEFPNV